MSFLCSCRREREWATAHKETWSGQSSHGANGRAWTCKDDLYVVCAVEVIMLFQVGILYTFKVTRYGVLNLLAGYIFLRVHIRDRPIIIKQVPIFLFLNSPVIVVIIVVVVVIIVIIVAVIIPRNIPLQILQTFTSAFWLSPRVLVIATYLTNSDDFQTLHSLQLDHSLHRSRH